MQALREFAEQELTWKQSNGASGVYELRDGENVLAALHFNRPLGTHSILEAADGEWTLGRGLHVRRTIAIHGSGPANADTHHSPASAQYTPAAVDGAGLLETADGRRYLWRPVDDTGCHYVWVDQDSTHLVGVERLSGHAGLDGVTMIARAAADMPDLSLLVLFGWYLMLMQ